jgi:predicted lipid-binding transport protein (Tim44 family)
MLFVLYGLAPGSDISAHLGGLTTGLGLGLILARLPAAVYQSFKVNLTCAIVLGALTAGTWWLALKAG